jgi:Outer membrane protein beta-barrel domain
MGFFARSAIVACVFVSSPCFAQNASSPGDLYVSGGYDYLDIEGVNFGTVQGRLGHSFTPNFAIEGVGGLGINDEERLGAKARIRGTLGGFLVASAPLGERFSVLGRLGYLQTWAELKAFGFTKQEDVGSVAIGVGAQFHLDDTNGLRGDYTHYPSNSGVNGFSLSYVRKF